MKINNKPDLGSHVTVFTVEPKRNGFTILEIIIALTVLSLITLIIGSSFNMSIKAWEKGESEVLETQRLRILSSLLFQTLKSAYPYEMKIDNNEVTIFEGEKNSILFATSFNDSTAGGFKWVRYSYSDRVLSYNEGILPDKNFYNTVTDNEEIIDSDIGEITFEYLHSDDKEWKESWSLSDGLPSAVKVKIAHFEPFQITIPMGPVNTDEFPESR